MASCVAFSIWSLRLAVAAHKCTHFYSGLFEVSSIRKSAMHEVHGLWNGTFYHLLYAVLCSAAHLQQEPSSASYIDGYVSFYAIRAGSW